MAKDIIKNIPLTLDINARKRLDGSIDIRLYSKDIATGQFEFTLIDEDNNPVELDETYSAQTLVKYEDEEKTYLDDMIIEGNIIRFIFPHDFITKDGIVTMYIYITKDSYTSDVAAISFNVYRSEIDDVATDIVAAYDKNYEDILAEFKQTLEDYKSTLPKADSVRAEIDEVLNQFSEDSQAKLLQFDSDAQQVIADNQTAFDLAESGRQNTYEQAETVRNQSSNQAVADWEQGADAIINVVEANESARVDAETTRKTAETDRVSSESTRKTNETTRVNNEDARKSAETIRLASEADRVNAENIRAEFYEGFDGEIATLKTEVENSIVGKRIGGYTFNGNTEVHVTNLDEETGVFTATNHGLVNGMRCTVALNPDTLLFNKTSLPDPLQKGWRFIVNATQDTFQVSDSQDGEPVLFTPNPSLDTNLWHLEAIDKAVTSIKLQGFSETELTIRFRVKSHIQGHNVFWLTLDDMEIVNNFHSEVYGLLTVNGYPRIEDYGNSSLAMFGEYKASLSEHAMIGKLNFYRADLANKHNPHSELSYKVFKDTIWANNTNKIDAFKGVGLTLGGHMLLNGSTLEVYNG